MARLTKGQSRKSKAATSKASANVISSEELGAGPMLFDLQDGQRSEKSGRARVLASRSRQQAREKAKKTNAICGRHGWPSSGSVALTASLGSKLAAAMDIAGSMEYALTWSRKVTPSGLRIWRLRASGRRTSAKGSSGLQGWPTPVAEPANGTPERFLERKRESVKRGSSMGICLSDLAMVAQLAVLDLAGWNTPTTNDAKQAQAATRNLSGQTQSLSPAEMESGGASRRVLNPAFSLWMMGYPPAWMECGRRAMQACSRSARAKKVGPHCSGGPETP